MLRSFAVQCKAVFNHVGIYLTKMGIKSAPYLYHNSADWAFNSVLF